jgi:uncharacterized membrane protein YhaH (DUF805 family)
MFKSPFSFSGRIRRTEYALSYFVACSGLFVLAFSFGFIGGALDADDESISASLALIYVPFAWFMWAQGAKRCHDLGNSGWWQLLPFYGFWMLFSNGEIGSNQYGDNPKNIQSNQQVVYHQPVQPKVGAGYQGGYSGGHNSPNTNSQTVSAAINNSITSNTSTSPASSGSGEYQRGSLYN